MPNTFHPRLQEDGSMTAGELRVVSEGVFVPEKETPLAPDADAISKPEAPAEIAEGTSTEATPAPETPETPPPPPAPETVTEDAESFWKIPKREGTYQALLAASKEDPNFDKRVRELVGRSLKREADAKVKALEAQLEVSERELARMRISQMAPEAVEASFKSDRDFRRTYTDLMDDEAADPMELAQEAAEAAYIDEVRENVFDDMRLAGFPDSRVEQYAVAFEYCPLHRTNEHGFYDHDNTGTFFEDRYPDPAVARKACLDYFVSLAQREMASQSRAQASAQAAMKTPAPAPQAAPPPPPPAAAIGTPNPAIEDKRPDMHTSANGQASGHRWTSEELSSMNPPDRIALVESMGGRRKMIEDGLLYIPGLSEKLT